MSSAMSIEQKEQTEYWPFRYRLLLLCLSITIAASLLLGLPLTRSAGQSLQIEAEHLRATLARQSGNLAADAIFTQDLVSLNVMLSQLVSHPQIAYAAVYNLDRTVLAEQGKLPAEEQDSPPPITIQYQSQAIGLFEVIVDKSSIEQALTRLYALWASLSLILIAVSGLAGWLIGKQHGHTLDIIRNDVVGLSDSESDIEWVKQGELAGLTHALRSYKHHQQTQSQVDQALAKFMTPNVNNQFSPESHFPNGLAAADLPEEYAHAAILFIDFVDFRQARKGMSPQALASLLNQYYFFINQAARLYNGSVDKYVGEGVMVLFGIPQQDEKDCFHGVCTAMLLIGLLKQFNQQREEQHLPIIDFKLGLHTGRVLAGTFGDRDNMTYTAVGDNLHTAARLCHKSQRLELLISESVIEQGKLNHQLHLSSGPEVRSSQPEHYLQTFWVDELATNYQALIERQVQHISSMKMDEVNE